MGYLDLIKPLQTVDLSQHLGFYIEQERVGWIHHGFAKHLHPFDDVFEFNDTHVTLSDKFHNFDDRSDALKNILTILEKQDIIPANPFGAHNDNPAFQKVDIFPIGSDPFNNPLAGVDRWHAALFGIRRYSTCALVHSKDKTWIATRGPKVKNPGKLDLPVSGCCTTEYTLLENLASEAYDEAGLSGDIVDDFKLIGSYFLLFNRSEFEIFNEEFYVYTLDLPNDITPETTQPDEVSSFQLMSLDELADKLLNTDDIPPITKTVFIYYFIKSKYITEKNKEYNELIAALNHDPATKIDAC